MNPGLLLAIAVGAGVGSVARAATDRLVFLRYGPREIPWATLAVNTVGSLLVGLLNGANAAGLIDDSVKLVLGTGLAGGLTTFSTLSWELHSMARQGEYRRLLGYAGASIILGLLAVGLGSVVAGLLV